MTILHEVRLARGLSMRDLAKLTGFTHNVIYRLETGKQHGCQPRNRLALERALGLPLDVLLQTTNAAAPEGDGEEATIPPRKEARHEF